MSTVRAITRRNFLRLAGSETGPAVEVSCQKLHMSYMEVQITAADGAPCADADASMGEAPAAFAERSVDNLLADLERAVSGAAVLRVVDAVWLTPEDLRRRVDAIAQAFRARGGTIEFVP